MGCKDAMVSLNWVRVGLRWEHSTGKVKQVSRHTDKVISVVFLWRKSRTRSA